MRSYWDWETFGEDIRRTVQRAVDSQDFRRLNQTINDTINNAAGEFRDGVRHAGERNRNGGYSSGQDKYTQASKGAAQTFRGVDVSKLRAPDLYAKMSGKKAGAMALAILGYGFGSLFLFGVVLGAVTVLVLGNAAEMVVGMTTLGIMTCIFGGMAASGTRKLGRIKRFERYVKELKGKEYCNIDEIALRVRRKEKQVYKDIRWMIEKGWFRQGHLDDQDACLMISDAAYEEYRDLMEQREVQKRMQEEDALKSQADARKKEQYSKEKQANMDPQIQAVIQAGNEYIRKIRECNDAIPGEAVSEKMYRMELLTKRIFERVEQDPDSVEDIRKLMEYYLPTAVKLLEAYEKLDAQPVQGENILSSKKEIEDTLDTLNIAFEKLLDDLFQETAWDVSSDISVLKTMLAQEGLTGKDFETGGKR
nr:5-bromo-4-chloroindolyl phosphate hydrolysis family protein [uncultured Sellimonas sp.]